MDTLRGAHGGQGSVYELHTYANINFQFCSIISIIYAHIIHITRTHTLHKPQVRFPNRLVTNIIEHKPRLVRSKCHDLIEFAVRED